MSYLNGFKFKLFEHFIMHGRYKPVVRLDLAVGCVPMRLFPINLSFLEVGSRPEYLPNVIIAERRLACVFTFLLNELSNCFNSRCKYLLIWIGVALELNHTTHFQFLSFQWQLCVMFFWFLH
ncbi:uncharacterized protein LOC100573095 [Acyrthosiphon pisum]|uniref:Uncharacterized protein n=1 Tax=Acyrthosiphon pisum TaxID=7029 RepID=A0A8R2H648_ACYPI|nr:uncharacterized protein LOC100573095 [Acyrthosiphon pisum]|eukprot:XP_016657327.1 PREDICTED: uncharacterized protein LOC100573095 [Acyrthosiphon pisum]